MEAIGMNSFEYCSGKLGISDLQKWWDTSTQGDDMLWMLARLVGKPGEQHGGVHRHMIIRVVLQYIDECFEEEKSDRPFNKVYDKTFKWLTMGSSAATIGCVRSSIFKHIVKYDTGTLHRALIYLISFTGNLNCGYDHHTAYDDAYWNNIKVIKSISPLSINCLANILRQHSSYEILEAYRYDS
jgi:hypothetical protein